MITERWSFELFFDRGGEGIGVGMSPRDLSDNHLAHPISPLDLPEIGILYLCYRCMQWRCPSFVRSRKLSKYYVYPSSGSERNVRDVGARGRTGHLF